jgi:hypothetical protein
MTASVVAATHTSCQTDLRHNLPYERDCYVGMYT